jgi:hypothetical protein
MRKIIKYSLAYLILIAAPAQAQEANNWYFGLLNGLRLNFTSSPPTVTNGYPLVTEEGSAAISDNNGNPLFYTDGVKIWDASTNTTFGTGLLGGTSSTQSAIIIPKPGTANQWLLFTSNTDPNNGTASGINYYTVTGSPGAFSISTATQIALGNEVGEGLCIMASTKPGYSYWVISHERAAGGSKNIRAYSVSNTGVVNSTPQLSSSSSAVSFAGYIGSIKANTCQTRIAFTYYSASATAEVYDFDASTGSITILRSSIPISHAYGLEFSPNDNYLYLSQLDEGTLHQFNITAGTDYTEAAWDRSGEMGQLQLAPDGKIYAALHGGGSSNEYLGVINQPDMNQTNANYVMNGLLVTTQPNPNGFVFRGLPTFSKTIVAGILQAIPGDGEYCVNTSIAFSFTYTGSVSSIDWDWGDGTAHGSTASISHSYTTTGIKNVVLTITDGCGKIKTKNITLNILDPKIPAASISCGTGTVTLNAGGPDVADYPNYVWYNSPGLSSAPLGVGSSYTYQAGNSSALPGEICVEVASSASTSSSGVNKSVGSSNILANAANGTPYISPDINVLADQLILKSFDVKLYPACTNATFTVTIKNSSAVTLYTGSFNSGGTCGIFTVNVNTTLPKGNGYTITVTAPGGVLLYRDDWRGATNPGEITYVADPHAGTTSVSNLKYDFSNYQVSKTCSNRICYPINCSVLPLTLYSFDAIYKNETVLISWSASQKNEGNYFEVESSSDGINFLSIGKVFSEKSDAGIFHYSLEDQNPHKPINYYRLTEYSKEGIKQETGPVKEVQKQDLTIRVNANPSSDQFNISIPFSEKGKLFTIRDILGKIIYQKTLEENEVELSIGSEWSAGCYFLQYDFQFNTRTVKLIKE